MPNDVISKIELPNGDIYDLKDDHAVKEDLSYYNTAAYPYTGQELIFLRNPVTGASGVTDITTLLSSAAGGDSDQGALVHYTKTVNLAVSTTSQTFTDEKISANMVVLEYTFGDPLAQYTDLNITTADGSVTIAGTITAATSLTLYFGVAVTVPPTIQVNLASSAADNILKVNSTPGVFGVLSPTNGGTGLSASPSVLVNLASTTATNILQVNPRPGVTGVLGVANGGTGANTKADARANLEVLALTGGTVTGDIVRKNVGVDATKADNNVTGTAYPTTFNIVDTNGKILGRQEVVIQTDGKIGSYWYVRNYNTSGDQVAQKGISMKMDKSGNLTYDISDASNFRSAIGAFASSGGNMTGTITFNKVTNAIAYTGSQATYNMIKFKDNANDNYGNGIIIGGGGAVIIGGGESADTVAAQVESGGEEKLYLCNDGDVVIFSNIQSGWDSRKTFTFGSNGTLTASAFNGNVTGNCSGSAGSTTKLTLAGTNTKSTSTNTYATNGLNIRYFNATGNLPGQPSQYGFLLTMSTGDSSSETHQIFAEQANGSLYHRGTNSSTYTNPPTFKTIVDSSNYGSFITPSSIGALATSGGTVTGQLVLSDTTDISGTAASGSALVIGTKTGTHLAFDGNEIMAKSSATTVGTLNLNIDGGNVVLGAANASYNVQVRPTTASTSKTTGALVVGGGVGVAGSVYANAFYGPLTGNVTGDVTGSAGTASLVRNRTSITKGTNPSATQWITSVQILQSGSGTAITDRIGGFIESSIDTSGNTSLWLHAYQFASGSSARNTFSISIAKDGTASYSVSNPVAFLNAINIKRKKITNLTPGTNGTVDLSLSIYQQVISVYCTDTILQALPYYSTSEQGWRAKCINGNNNAIVTSGPITLIVAYIDFGVAP